MVSYSRVGNVANCSGCGLCESLCHRDAISMQWSRLGFLEPHIDSELCVNCGLCLRKCPQVDTNGVHQEASSYNAYGAWNTNEDIREHSSSGGIFSALSEYVIEREGAVFGVVWRDKLTAAYARACTLEELQAMRGSKYTQALPEKVYREVRHLLKIGKLVLFSGTPCQVYALNTYLGRNYDNLITVDVVCHGIPSRVLFEKYIEEQEKRSGKIISRISFREKPSGWKRFHVARYYEDTSKDSCPFDMDAYMRLFLSDKALKEACYNCQYANCPRAGDITIGDFWGVEHSHPEWPLSGGVSAVLASSLQGSHLLHQLAREGKIELFSARLEEMIVYQGGFVPVRPQPEDRNDFLRSMLGMSLCRLVWRFLDSVRIGPFYVRRGGWAHERVSSIRHFWQRGVGYLKIKLGIIKR